MKENSKGIRVERKTPVGVYYCGQLHEGHISPNCPRTIGTKKADDHVWQEVCRAVNDPEILIAKAHQVVDELRKNAEMLYDDKDRVQRELDAVTSERQWVITQARKGAINDSDMEYQLGALTLQELSLKREFASIGNAVEINTLDNWDDQVREYFADLQIGLESLNAAPQNDEKRQEIFTLKRDIVLALVQKVTIDRNRDLSVHFNLDILRILQEQAKKQGGGGDGAIFPNQIGMGGTCSHRR